MVPDHSDNNSMKRKTLNTKTSKKSSLWKLLCPCFSSKNSDSDGDDKAKDSYIREDFYEEKTINESNIHEETETNLPIDFKIPGFLLQNHTNPQTINQNPEFNIKNDPQFKQTSGIKFNIKKNNTLQVYLNENRNPNIQLSKQSNNDFSHNEKQRSNVRKPKSTQLSHKKYNEYRNKQKFSLQNIDYRKMQKDHVYFLQIFKQLQRMSGTTNGYEFLKNVQQPLQRQYPINLLQQNKLIVIGEKNHKILAKVTSAKLYPSVASIKRLKESLQNKKNETKFVKKDENFNRALDRYWERRYFLFEKFDEGIQLDEQSWYSVTPQSVADYISSRINVKETLLDAFCGAGGDSLKLAGACGQIISNDIDPVKLKCLMNNSKIYDVQNITLSNADFFKLDIKVDAVYLAPPWGGPDYFKILSFHPADFQPKLTDIIQKAFTLSPNIILLLPINTNIEALAAVINEKICKVKDFKPQSCSIRIEKLFYCDSLKFLLVLFGDSSIITNIKLTEELCFIYDMFRENDQTYFRHKKLIRKIREEYGMVNLLNYVFEAQNYTNQANKNNSEIDTTPMIEKFESYLLKNKLIDEKNLQKIKQEQEKEYQYDLKHRSQKNKRLKEKKIQKFLQKQGQTYNKDKPNQQQCSQVIDSEEDQIPVSQIVKKVKKQNHEEFNRTKTYDLKIDIQSSNREIPIRDSLRTVSMISEFQQEQLRNINQTQRGTTNSQLSFRDSIHPVQKYDDFQISIDVKSKISQQYGRLMPNSAEKDYDQNFFESSGHRMSEPLIFGKKEEVKMKKVKAGTFQEKEITESVDNEKET